MRLALAVCIGLFLLSPCYGQTGGDDPEGIIRRNIDRGFFEGHDQKVIGGLGDAGAVLITKILAGRELTANNIDNALVVIGHVFSDPRFVAVASDREPKTALLLLRYLDLSTNDAVLKKHIADTSKYIQDRYAASLQATKQ